MFDTLNFPAINTRIIQGNNATSQIFDICRKKFVDLTPEEWVRQHTLHYLIYQKNYPLSLISVEKQLKLNTTSKRTDIVIYNSQLKPLMIVECKASTVAINQDTLNQIARYNLTLDVPYLLLTNGLSHCCIRVNENNVLPLKEIPLFEELMQEKS